MVLASQEPGDVGAQEKEMAMARWNQWQMETTKNNKFK